MTKTVRLLGGPEHGRLVEVAAGRLQYIILRPVAPGAIVMLKFEKGYYKAMGKSEDQYEVLEWAGWEGDMN